MLNHTASTSDPHGEPKSALVEPLAETAYPRRLDATDDDAELNFSTAWSTNAVSICHSIGLHHVKRIECSQRHLFKILTPREACVSRCTPSDLSQMGRALLLTILFLAILITLAGNLLIIASIAFFRQLQTRSNVLVASLAAADLLVGSLIMPFSAMRTADNCWPYGDLFCLLHTWLDFSATCSSIINLACISAERYISVSDPLRYRQRVTPRVLIAMLTLSWSGLAVYGATFLAGWNVAGMEGVIAAESCPHSCRVFMNAATTFANVGAYVAPMLVMAAANVKTYGVARDQARKVHASGPLDAHGRSRWEAMKREHNATKTMGIIMGVFILLWLPYILLASTEPMLGYGTTPATWEAVNWLPYINSTVNPVLLASFNRSFNGAFRVILGGKATRPGARGTDLYNLRDRVG
ncbi:unnamed protein product [Lampetra planeri]